MNLSCPHCGASNDAAAAFCESCGKALPTSAPRSPRVVSADALPQSAVGAQMVGDELVKQQKSASNALLAVAILTLVVGIILGVVANSARNRFQPGPGAVSPVAVIIAVQVILSAIFFGLYFWSRRSPLPATIVGLCLYATLIAVNVVVSVGQLTRKDGEPTGLGFGILDIVIIFVLARAIMAGLKHRRLQQAGLHGA